MADWPVNYIEVFDHLKCAIPHTDVLLSERNVLSVEIPVGSENPNTQEMIQCIDIHALFQGYAAVSFYKTSDRIHICAFGKNAIITDVQTTDMKSSHMLDRRVVTVILSDNSGSRRMLCVGPYGHTSLVLWPEELKSGDACDSDISISDDEVDNANGNCKRRRETKKKLFRFWPSKKHVQTVWRLLKYGCFVASPVMFTIAGNYLFGQHGYFHTKHSPANRTLFL